jgi:BlaI family transcriptional regulator, penicillinase repressor
MRRPAPPRDIPPPLELACLKALWGLGEGTVRDVRHMMVGNRNLAYTTVMTVLERLEKRGGVSRRKQGRSFVYAPKVSQDVLRRFAVKELIDGFFGGSEEALLEYLNKIRESRSAGQGPGDDSIEQLLLWA